MKPNLAEAYDSCRSLTWPKYASPKLDGIRATVQKGKLLSRSLKLIPNQAVRELLASCEGLDGELICGPSTAPDVYNRTYRKIMAEKEDVKDVIFYAFDLLDLTAPYKTRLQELQLRLLPPLAMVLPQHLLQSEVSLTNYYAEMLSQGYEGAILRNPEAMYKQGRSTAASQDMLKLKPFEDSEGQVLAFYEAMENQNSAFTNELGKTDRSTHAENLVPKGMLGGFVVKVQNGKFAGTTTNIAPGKLTHAERTFIWNNPADFLHKVLSFRHLPHGAVDAPRHARFYRWRVDSSI